MSRFSLSQLGRRERQIMEIVLREGRATASEVQAALPDPVTNSSVRGMLRLLVSKGYLAVEQDGPRYIYSPVLAAEDLGRSAARHLVSTFFRSSTSSAVAALLESADHPLTDAEYQRLLDLLEQAREAGDRR